MKESAYKIKLLKDCLEWKTTGEKVMLALGISRFLEFSLEVLNHSKRAHALEKAEAVLQRIQLSRGLKKKKRVKKRVH